jgi:hypothetical protein
MRNQTLTIILLLAIIFSSCSHVYTPALYHQDIAYLPKPASFDSSKVATYVSAGGSMYTNTNYSDLLQSGQVNLSQGFTAKNVNFAYGVFGVAGNYENSHNSDATVNNFNDKFFGAIGGRASVNLYTNSGQFDIRYLGVEAAYSHEFGDYADFRKSIYGMSGFNVDPRTDLFTLGLTSELYFHSLNNGDLQHGIRGFLGGTFGHYDLDYQTALVASNSKFFHELFPKASYFIKYKKYFGTVEIGNGLFARFGLQF